MTKRKGTLAGSPALKGIGPPQTQKEKLRAGEKRRKDSNDELRTARCIICRQPRSKGSYPIHRECCTRSRTDRVVTLRPYLYTYHPEGAVDG